METGGRRGAGIPLTPSGASVTLQSSVSADVAQLVEHPPCKRKVEGSSPSVSSFAVAWDEPRRSHEGGVPKRSNGADCKSAGLRLRRFESYPHHFRIKGGPGSGKIRVQEKT